MMARDRIPHLMLHSTLRRITSAIHPFDGTRNTRPRSAYQISQSVSIINEPKRQEVAYNVPSALISLGVFINFLNWVRYMAFHSWLWSGTPTLFRPAFTTIEPRHVHSLGISQIQVAQQFLQASLGSFYSRRQLQGTVRPSTRNQDDSCLVDGANGTGGRFSIRRFSNVCACTTRS